MHIYSMVLAELSLDSLKFEPELQTHFMFARLVKKATYLSFSVLIRFYCAVVYVPSHDLRRVLKFPKG